MFSSYFNESILARAKKNKLIDFKFYNPRDFVKVLKNKNQNNYRPVDDRPYGGGPGMVMRAEPIIHAVSKALSSSKGKNKKTKIILFSPSGKKFTTVYAKSAVKKYTDIILISGRYEGIDTRVVKIFKAEEISIGDYVLTGGELPAMVLIDCISRQIKGVLGKFESLEEERVSTSLKVIKFLKCYSLEIIKRLRGGREGVNPQLKFDKNMEICILLCKID